MMTHSGERAFSVTGTAEDEPAGDKPKAQKVEHRALPVLLPVIALATGALFAIKGWAWGGLPLALEVLMSLLALSLAFWTVFIVLHHAEAIAHRVGEPYGTLVLTVAVTAIEASVIVSVMLQGTPNPALARESVFSTVMIVCGGIVGMCFTLGGLRHLHQELKRQGTSALLTVVVALSVLTLVLPKYTLTAEAGLFSSTQLVFVSVLCLLLYGSFVLAQMTRHRDDFLDKPTATRSVGRAASENIAKSCALLTVGLVGIVLLAEYVANGLEKGLGSLQLAQTDAIVGAFVATLVLLPETVAAIKASLNNELQRSLNIALGSACATIGLTVPVIGLVSLATGTELILGLGSGDMVLLALALAISMISFGTGRTTMLTGAVHLVVFVAYLMLIAVP